MTTTVPDYKQARRDEFIDSLRQIADFLDAHPDVPQPYHLLDNHYYIYLHGDDQRAQLQTIARAMGRAEKSTDDRGHFLVSRKFGGITLIAQADRAQVCERVVVGTREVEVEEPDPDAVAALPKVKRTTLVEDVEWVCPPSLLGEPDAVDRVLATEQPTAEQPATTDGFPAFAVSSRDLAKDQVAQS